MTEQPATGAQPNEPSRDEQRQAEGTAAQPGAAPQPETAPQPDATGEPGGEPGGAPEPGVAEPSAGRAAIRRRRPCFFCAACRPSRTASAAPSMP